MSAGMELHVALSLRLDAKEAYRLAHAYRDEELAKDQATPLVVSRFDVAMEHAPEEEPGLTIGAIAENGRPVALRFDVEDRRKVGGWLTPVGEEATAAAATATLDFFQVGHTYTEPNGCTDWKFRCDAITTHPEDGERTALGWRHFRGEWSECAYGEDDWEIHQIADRIDVTEAGDDRA